MFSYFVDKLKTIGFAALELLNRSVDALFIAFLEAINKVFLMELI